MRRLLLASLLLVVPVLPLAGCGGANPAVDTPLVKDMMQKLSLSVVSNEKEEIVKYFVLTAGTRGNPLLARDADSPEGKAKLEEMHRRDIRSIYKDSGILAPGDVDRLMAALRIAIVDEKNAVVRFDIADRPGRRAELVTLQLVKTTAGYWRIYHYEREVGMVAK